MHVEEMRREVERLESEHRAAGEKQRELEEALNPAGWLHIAATLGDAGAAGERDRVSAERDRAGSRASALFGELKTARDRLDSEESRERRAALERLRAAEDFTVKLRREFAQHLANTGWYTQSGEAARVESEARAVFYVEQKHGAAAAEYCREYVLPSLGGDSSTFTRSPGAPQPSYWAGAGGVA
jgi:hypothetical protein